MQIPQLDQTHLIHRSGVFDIHFCRVFRMLREARDNAVSEKERALATEKETYTKYEQLLYE